MKILLINHYAGSTEFGMEFRPYYMAREWIKNGHDVTIIAGSYSHLRTKQPNVKRSFEEHFIEGIQYVWVKTPVYKGNGVIRFLSMLVFVFKLLFRHRYISEKYRPDVVIASSTYPLDNYAAHRIAERCDAMHVYEVHDLWPLSPQELGGMSKFHPFVVLMKKAENYAYKKVDKVISMLPLTLEHMTSHGLDPLKWDYVPNGISVDEWKKSEPIPGIIAKSLSEIKDNGNLIIAYTGSIGLANAIDNFLDASAKMIDEKITFVIVGSGHEKSRLMQRAKKENLNNVLFFDPVSRKSIPQLLMLCDILYIGLQRQPLFRFGISPNKILDYMMAAKPVIQAIDAGNNITGEAKCGFSIQPEDPDGLVSAIHKIMKMTENERNTLGNNGKEYVVRNHNYKSLADKMLRNFQM